MESIRRNLKRARESDPMSREQYSYDSWNLGVIKGMVSYWADEYTLNGEKLKGQDLVRWKKEVFHRIRQLDAIFKEDAKLKEEARNE